MKDREKELKLLMYEENQIIKQSKKRIKMYRDELNRLNYKKRVYKNKKL